MPSAALCAAFFCYLQGRIPPIIISAFIAHTTGVLVPLKRSTELIGTTSAAYADPMHQTSRPFPLAQADTGAYLANQRLVWMVQALASASSTKSYSTAPIGLSNLDADVPVLLRDQPVNRIKPCRHS